jgi:hypothetical protein
MLENKYVYDIGSIKTCFDKEKKEMDKELNKK